MKNKTLITLVLSLCFLILNACTPSSNTQKTISGNEPITIGIVTALTGDIASLGKSAEQGTQLAYEEFEKQSDENKIKLIYEDSRCKPDTAINAANKLININNTKIILGTICSSVTLALAPITEQKKLYFSLPAPAVQILPRPATTYSVSGHPMLMKAKY